MIISNNNNNRVAILIVEIQKCACWKNLSLKGNVANRANKSCAVKLEEGTVCRTCQPPFQWCHLHLRAHLIYYTASNQQTFTCV